MHELIKDLISKFYSRPITTVAMLLIFLIAFVTYKSYDKIEALVVTPKDEAARFHESLESMQLINTALAKIKTDTGARGVTIYQFHNGKHDLTGIPFTGALVTFSTEGYTGDMPLSTLNASLRLVWQDIDAPRCQIINRAIDSETANVFDKYGQSYQIICPLINPLNYPVGLLTVGYTTKPPEFALAEIEHASYSIVGYLNFKEKK